ncbi:MAG: SPOR domain-containing protein [Albidovulum sp.]
MEPASAAPEGTEKILAVETVPEEVAAVDGAAASQPAAEPQADAPKISGWSVQLASAATEDAAWSTWKKMQAQHKALAAKEPVVVKADLGTKGIFYRVRLVGFDTQSDASSECSRLKSKGVKCYISKAAS